MSEIKKINLNDSLYPALLKEISDPPKVLYYCGQFPTADLFPLAVVGSRQSDEYGEAVITKIFTPDILEKIVIVSGLAIGIDAAAHQIAKHTIAVLGTGLDEASFYPKSNWSLCQKIIKNGGLVISEHPIGTIAKAEHFPKRNRIIAGLSRATLVVQAKIRSGALITARLALENGRDVFVVPGSILSDLSQGPHLLISQGAAPISSSDDLRTVLGL
jgi:DNA processing protein